MTIWSPRLPRVDAAPSGSKRAILADAVHLKPRADVDVALKQSFKKVFG